MRYEVAVSIRNGDIAWANGLFPAGSHTDSNIFLCNLIGFLQPGERVEANAGYGGILQIRVPMDFVDQVDFMAKARTCACHKTVNARLKNSGFCWKC